MIIKRNKLANFHFESRLVWKKVQDSPVLKLQTHARTSNGALSVSNIICFESHNLLAGTKGEK
jgi:hypothetical protein